MEQNLPGDYFYLLISCCPPFPEELPSLPRAGGRADASVSPEWRVSQAAASAPTAGLASSTLPDLSCLLVRLGVTNFHRIYVRNTSGFTRQALALSLVPVKLGLYIGSVG